jgi:hypothetical protein
MHRDTSWSRRALAFLGRTLWFTLRVIFVLLMIVVPIPILPPRYRPYRERQNPVVQMLEKE